MYGRRHGNLRNDGTEPVLERALTDEAVYFGSAQASPSEVAAGWGDASGARVYFEPESVRYVWLDRARRGVKGAPSRRT